MKLDIEYIKQLLNVMNECEDDQVEMGYLFENLTSETNEIKNIDEKKLRHHLYLLYEAGYIQSSDLKLGFMSCVNGQMVCMSNTKYWFTLRGYQLLETLNNDTLYNKVVKGLKNIGVDTLKQLPALGIELIINNCFGK